MPCNCHNTDKFVFSFFIRARYLLKFLVSQIKDYRTAVTGITAQSIANTGVPYRKVKQDIADLIRGQILVVHDFNKLKKFGLSHPEWNKRDTLEYFWTVSALYNNMYSR